MTGATAALPARRSSRWPRLIEFLLGQRRARDVAGHAAGDGRAAASTTRSAAALPATPSTPTWTVPHFEKMLYDNALLARAYLHGWQVSGDPLLRRACEETLDWALREMRGPEGGFCSALDADSEGVEGKFYVWTPDELRDVLGELAEEAIAYFGATEAGNSSGANVLEARGPEPRSGRDPRGGCYDARAERVRPGLDDKRLTAWNALMISALAEAGRRPRAP